MNEDQTAAENRIAKMPQYVEHLVLLKTKRSPTAEEAERIARVEHGSTKLAVISGVGTRHYYAKLGYHLELTYMVKNLPPLEDDLDDY